MKNSEYCQNCGKHVEVNWIWCGYCSSSIYRKEVNQCKRCYNTTQNTDLLYCPFCSYEYVMQKPVQLKKIESSSIIDTYTQEREIEDLEKYTDAPINKNTWKSFLKFNKPAMYTIATNKSIEKRSSQLIYSHILISGLTLALIMLLFNENPFTIPILRGFVNVIFVYFATILSYNFFLHKILVFFGNKPAKGIIKNHFSAQISFLIIGLALSVITSIYIRIFDASGLLFGLIIVILILVLTCIIMVVHHILFIKIVTDENFLLILVITYIAGAFAWIFGGYYVQIMLDYIWRLII